MEEFDFYKIAVSNIEFIQNNLQTDDLYKVPLLVISLYLGFKLMKGIYTTYLGHQMGLGVKWRPSPKTWAVVTGATDGIGLEYAKQFGEMGYSLVLLGRDKIKLEHTKIDLIKTYERCHEITTLAVDFTQNNIYDKIGQILPKDKDIDVLVNNVGMGGTSSSSAHEYFHKQSKNMQAHIPDLINCNMLSMTRMIQLVLPGMIERKRGIIINIASTAGTVPLPFMSMYSASKAYMDYLSRSLDIEYKNMGIVFQSVLPGVVATKLVNLDPKKTYAGIPSAKEYVEAAIKTVGIEKRTYGHPTHKWNFFIKDTIAKLGGVDKVSDMGFDMQKVQRKKFYHDNGFKDDM